MKATFLIPTFLLFALNPTGFAAPENLLLNPGFEEGTADQAPPWGVGGWRGTIRPTTAEHHSGKRSLMLEGGGDEGGINSATQIVPIDPTGRTKYKMSAWIKVPSGTGRARTRWYFDDDPATNAGQYTDVTGTDWMQFDQGDTDIIPGPGAQHIVFRIYFVVGQPAGYLDDCVFTGEPSGNANYPGVQGTVKDANGNPVANAVVFLKAGPNAQEFALNSATTDSTGNYTLCTKDDGAYSVVAWKAGYALSEEKQVTIAAGAALAPFNPVLTKTGGGRNLAISTSGRKTAFGESTAGRYDDPQFQVGYLFDGNNITTRYYNNATVDPAGDRWVYVDLDPVGKTALSVNEFVLYGLGYTLMTQGWPGGPADTLPKSFAVEYTTKDPATETEAGWGANVAYSTTDSTPVVPPVVMRLQNPISARAVRLHMTAPNGGTFGPVEFQVNSDKSPRGTISGVVKDAGTGAPVAGAKVFVFQPVHIQSDPDIYGLGTTVPFVVAEEEKVGTPYEYPVAKNTQQIATTDSTGKYTVDADPGLPVKLTVSASGYPYLTASVLPAEDGSNNQQDFALGKEVTVSGVVKDGKGPIYNAIVQIGGATSPAATTVTGADGTYSLVVGAGAQEVYADAFGHAGKVETITLTSDLTKDITLDTQDEPGSFSADFEKVDQWEIGLFDTTWKAVGTRAATADTTQNTTPNGKSSALIEDAAALDSSGKELPQTYEMLQRVAGQRFAVDPSKSYNIYLNTKSDNWVSPEHQDSCHYEIQWLDQNGAILDRVYSHPHWINPQPFWQQYFRGHPAGADHSLALARLAPPAGTAFLDFKVGWIRNPSGATDDNPAGTNPAGSKLFVDDLVIDAFSAGNGSNGGATISAVRTTDGLSITFTGSLEGAAEATGPWTAVPGATSPLAVKADQARHYYRSRAQ